MARSSTRRIASRAPSGCGRRSIDSTSTRCSLISHGGQNHETIRVIAPHLETPEELAFLVRAEEECREGIVAVRGARTLLESLKPAGSAVVTSAWRHRRAS
jgi:hypothetical protein